MADRGDKTEKDDPVERRIERARTAIGKSFEELLARGEGGADEGSSPPIVPPDIEGRTAPPGDPAEHPASPDPDDIAAAVERRVSAWVDGRVRAAERRLELQSEAFEAALGEEAVGARRATEQVEAVRRSLAAAADQALTEVSAAVSDAREQLSTEVRDRVDAALKEAELRVRSLGSAMQDEFRSSVLEANRLRIDQSVDEATAALRRAAEKERSDLHRELGVQIAEARSELAASFDSRLQRELAEAVERVEGEGRRATADAATAAGAAASEEVERRLPELEERIDRGAEDQRAAIEARFGAAEAALRSRIGVAVDEAAKNQDHQLREEASAHRRRINDELAAALQSTADELRRQLDAEREGARLEFSAAARTEIAAAVERLDELHSAAVRDAREAAEAIAASRMADAREGLAAELGRAHEESLANVERELARIDSRLRSHFDRFESEQGAVAAQREEDSRRRAEERLSVLGEHLGERISRDVARELAAARASLEEANAEAAERNRADAREGAEAAIAREVAKGEARLAAATERLDALAHEKIGSGIDAAEKRLIERLDAHQLEARSQLEERFQSLSGELSAGLAEQSAKAATDAAAAARTEALGTIGTDAEAAVARAIDAAQGELDARAAESARAALAAESTRTGEELQRAMAASAGEQMQAIREESSRVSYRRHDRRAEAAAAAQLARSLDALKQRRTELAAELEAEAGMAHGRRSAELDAAVKRGRADLGGAVEAALRGLEERASELRVETEAAVGRRAEEAVATELDRRTAALEERVAGLMAAEEERIAAQLSAAVSEAEQRLESVEEAQAREERVRERTAIAEREAAERVREAERQLVDVLGRIGASERAEG